METVEGKLKRKDVEMLQSVVDGKQVSWKGWTDGKGGGVAN